MSENSPKEFNYLYILASIVNIRSAGNERDQ